MEGQKKMESIEYETWYGTHQNECSINHSGSSDKMEINAITEMFLRSVDRNGVKYVTYIGD